MARPNIAPDDPRYDAEDDHPDPPVRDWDDTDGAATVVVPVPGALRAGWVPLPRPLCVRRVLAKRAGRD